MQQVIFENADNSIALILKANTLADPTLKVIDLTDITRMTLNRRDGFIVDSAKESAIFDWATLAVSGIVVIQLGHLNLKNGEDYWRLKVFDATNTKGLVWGDEDFIINIKREYAASS